MSSAHNPVTLPAMLQVTPSQAQYRVPASALLRQRSGHASAAAAIATHSDALYTAPESGQGTGGAKLAGGGMARGSGRTAGSCPAGGGAQAVPQEIPSAATHGGTEQR